MAGRPAAPARSGRVGWVGKARAEVANADKLDMDEVRRYFALFDREDLLEALQHGR